VLAQIWRTFLKVVVDKMTSKHKAYCKECDEDLTEWRDRKEPVLNQVRKHEHDDIEVKAKDGGRSEQKNLGDW